MPYTGLTYPIQPGAAGFTGNKNQSAVNSSQLTLARDVTYEYGTLGKEGGAIQYNATPITGNPTVLAGYDWWPDPNTQRMTVLTSAGNVYKDSGTATFPTTLISGLNPPTRTPQFVTGGKETQAANRKLFLFTDTNMVKVLSGDGTTMADIALPPTDWTSTRPVCGCIHHNRLWGAAGHMVYFSNQTNHEDFTTSTPAGTTGFLTVYSGVGDEIVHIEDFKGLLLVFKRPFGIYFIDDSDPNVVNWTINTVSDSIGAAGPGCVISIDNDVLFMDRGGSINMLSAVTQQLPTGTIAASSLTYTATIDPYIRDNFNFFYLNYVQSIYYPAKREVHFAVPYGSSTVNNARMVIDYNNPNVVRFRDSVRDTCPALWTRKDANLVSRPMYGDNKGTVWYMDQPARVFGSAGYLSQWRTGYEDFSGMYVGFPSFGKLAGMNKNFHFLELVCDPKGNWNLMIDWYIDGNYTGTAPFNLGFTGAALDSFILNVNALAGDTVTGSRRRPIWGWGRRISFLGYTSGPGQDFSVEKLLVEFKPASE